MSKNSERYEWYTQDPREFRRKLWKGLFDSSKGGEVGRILAKSIRRHESKIRKRLANTSRATKGIVVVLSISSIGVFLKKDNQVSVAEIIFDNLESIALGSAGVIFLLEIPDRRKQSHVAAWQAINLAQGQVASGDRIQALQDLNKDNIDLSRIAVPGADLSYIDLSFANLMEANFEKTRFISANLEGANLERANLREAELNLANLQKAYLRQTDLRGAKLFQTNLREADLGGARLEGVQGEMVHLEKAKLRGTSLQGANLKNAYFQNSFLAQARLQKANLTWAYLRNADLRQANLKEAQLGQADLTGADLRGANLTGADLGWARNVTQDQLTQAELCFTRLPDGIELNSNRDCQELGIDPDTGTARN